MGRAFLILAAIVSIFIGIIAIKVIRSDIHLIAAMVGIIGGIIMWAQASILGKLSKLTLRQ
jgi:hypothetical protein